MKITAAHIHAEHGRATLRATLEGGSEQDTISWYVDELTFTPQDAIGKTVEELRQLHHQRDPRLPSLLSRRATPRREFTQTSPWPPGPRRAGPRRGEQRAAGSPCRHHDRRRPGDSAGRPERSDLPLARSRRDGPARARR